MCDLGSVWIDIENPPQVQYLVPFAQAFVRRGRPVLVTARDTGITLELLRARAVSHVAVGGYPPATRLRKLGAVAQRAAALRRLIGRRRPVAVVCSSRPAAIAARSAGIPCFVLSDYEYAEAGIYRRFGAAIVHPDVIPAERFAVHGFPPERLIAFRGIKEDISFAGVDVDEAPRVDFAGAGDGVVRVLVRPPAESSHYFSSGSRGSVLALLDHLSAREDVLTIFSPRHPSQIADVAQRTWRREPVVLRTAIPFVSLLRSVDRVVSAGGTMLREAAYVGVPAYSLFAGHLGSVDRYLADSGRLTLIRSVEDLPTITAPAPVLPPFPRNAAAVDEIADTVLGRANGSG